MKLQDLASNEHPPRMRYSHCLFLYCMAHTVAAPIDSLGTSYVIVECITAPHPRDPMRDPSTSGEGGDCSGEQVNNRFIHSHHTLLGRNPAAGRSLNPPYIVYYGTYEGNKRNGTDEK